MRFSGVLYQREAVVFFQETVLRAWKEVDDALTAYREAQHPRADLGRSVTEDQAALQAATERYSEGAIDFLNIVTTQAQLLQSENDLAVEAAVAGAPPILLHGALSDYRNWQPQIAEFSVGRGRIDQ
jgi:hypothetical protein